MPTIFDQIVEITDKIRQLEKYSFYHSGIVDLMTIRNELLLSAKKEIENNFAVYFGELEWSIFDGSWGLSCKNIPSDLKTKLSVFGSLEMQRNSPNERFFIDGLVMTCSFNKCGNDITVWTNPADDEYAKLLSLFTFIRKNGLKCNVAEMEKWINKIDDCLSIAQEFLNKQK